MRLPERFTSARPEPAPAPKEVEIAREKVKNTGSFTDAVRLANRALTDAGLTPPEGFDAGIYRELYGGEPDRVSYLFYPEPSTLIVTSTLPVTSTSAT